MSTGRLLKVGDAAVTDFNGSGTRTAVVITARLDGTRSQSGILFQVSPALKNSTTENWIDADWFEKAEQ